MADITKKSRYYRQPKVTRAFYESDRRETPERVDRVYGRRYTSWKPPSSTKTYTVLEGETMPGLAYRFWGDETLWYIIADFNPQIENPRKLKAGDTIYVPPVQRSGQTPSRL